MSDDPSLWIRRYHPSSKPTARIACLPHAGGSASFFLPFSKDFYPEYEVLSIQYPGRQDRRAEACIESATELAELVTQQLHYWCDLPLYIFGHSLGAILAFEIAQRLEARNLHVSALFASGRRAPSRQRSEATYLLSDDALIEEVRLLSRFDSMQLPSDELLRASLPAIRSDYKAAETYACPEDSTILKTDIHVHIGNSDTKVNVDEAEDWSRHTSGLFTRHMYSGGHFYLINNIKPLIRSIREEIAKDQNTKTKSL